MNIKEFLFGEPEQKNYEVKLANTDKYNVTVELLQQQDMVYVKATYFHDPNTDVQMKVSWEIPTGMTVFKDNDLALKIIDEGPNPNATISCVVTLSELGYSESIHENIQLN